MFPERIETDRLRLERLCHDNLDLFEYYRICSDDDGIEEVTRYMPWDPHETIVETKEFVDDAEEKWEKGETAEYIFRPKESTEGEPTDANDAPIAGQGGLHVDWERRTGELGTWFRKRFWGRGYSGERAAAMMELAFDLLDLELVAVTHHADNRKSRRAIEKYIEAHGGQREALIRNYIPYGDEVADEQRYTVTREQWLEATQ